MNSVGNYESGRVTWYRYIILGSQLGNIQNKISSYSYTVLNIKNLSVYNTV